MKQELVKQIRDVYIELRERYGVDEAWWTGMGDDSLDEFYEEVMKLLESHRGRFGNG